MALLHKNLLGIKKDEAYSCAGTDDILDVFNRHQTELRRIRNYIKGNKDKRTEEKYQCENCEGCPLRNQCHQSKNNRIISINRTLTSYHKEVIDNLASERGIELRCTRSYMAEGAFGVIKQDYNYRRISRVSLKKVNLELYLIIIGFNLAKYHNLKYRSNLEVC